MPRIPKGVNSHLRQMTGRPEDGAGGHLPGEQSEARGRLPWGPLAASSPAPQPRLPCHSGQHGSPGPNLPGLAYSGVPRTHRGARQDQEFPKFLSKVGQWQAAGPAALRGVSRASAPGPGFLGGLHVPGAGRASEERGGGGPRAAGPAPLQSPPWARPGVRGSPETRRPAGGARRPWRRPWHHCTVAGAAALAEAGTAQLGKV